MTTSLISPERIGGMILFVRGEKVMLDRDLAVLYGVETGALNRAVKRNRDRFPQDFVFQLTAEEVEFLRCQSGTSKTGSARSAGEGRGGRRYLPYVFTEQGVAMLSSVLQSRQAVRVNVAIMRAFVRLRGILATHKELAGKLAELERKISTHDDALRSILDAIRQLMEPPDPPPKRIGFRTEP